MPRVSVFTFSSTPIQEITLDDKFAKEFSSLTNCFKFLVTWESFN